MRTLALGSLALLLSVAGCSANIADGHFSCAADSDCPSGLTCQGGRCYRGDASAPTVDTGPGSDGGPGDDAGPRPDAGLCTTCIQVSVTNALSDGAPMAGGLDLDFEGTTITLPSYGQTSDLTTVDIGTDGKLTVHQAMLVLGGPITASPGTTYRYVVGGPSSMPSVQLVPDLTAPDPTKAKIQIVNLLSEPLTIALGSTIVTAPANGVSPVIENAVGTALAMTVSDANTMQAVFDWSQFPEGNYYVVISGDTQQHLASPQALHAVVVVSNTGRAYGSGVVYWVFNGSNAQVTACDGMGTMLGTLAPHALSAAVGATIGSSVTVHVDTRTDCAGAAAFHEVSVPTSAAGRVLLAVAGDTTATLPSQWTVQVLPEPAPGAATTVELVNGSIFSVDYLNGIDGPMFAGGVMPLQQTTYHPPASSPLTIIDVVIYEGGVADAMARIQWTPVAPIQWGVFSGTSVSAFDFAFDEIDAPYGMQPMVSTNSSM